MIKAIALFDGGGSFWVKSSGEWSRVEDDGGWATLWDPHWRDGRIDGCNWFDLYSRLAVWAPLFFLLIIVIIILLWFGLNFKENDTCSAE